MSQPVDPHADSRVLIQDMQARIAELEHYESEVQAARQMSSQRLNRSKVTESARACSYYSG